MATIYGLEPLASLISAGEDEVPVWVYPEGKAKGSSLSPIYRIAPALYRLLALPDALRTGRVRERDMTTRCMAEEPGAMDAVI